MSRIYKSLKSSSMALAPRSSCAQRVQANKVCQALALEEPYSVHAAQESRNAIHGEIQREQGPARTQLKAIRSHHNTLGLRHCWKFDGRMELRQTSKSKLKSPSFCSTVTKSICWKNQSADAAQQRTHFRMIAREAIQIRAKQDQIKSLQHAQNKQQMQSPDYPEASKPGRTNHYTDDADASYA